MPDEISALEVPFHSRLTLRMTSDQPVQNRPIDPAAKPKTEHQSFSTRHDGGGLVDVDDRRKPRSVEPIVQSRQIPISNASKIPGGGWSDRQPVAFLPIDQIVEAFLTRPSPVADLVMFESFGGQTIAGAVVHRRLDRIVDRVDASQPLLLSQRRSGFEDQTVAREMVGFEREYGIQITIPVVDGRSWDTEDQIETDATYSSVAQPLDGDRNATRIVPTLKGLQQIGLKTLATKTDSIDPPRDQRRGDGLAHRLRICFDRELIERLFRDRSDRCQDPSEQWRFQKRRRPAPDKGGTNLRGVDRTANRLGLELEPIGERFGSIALIHQRVKIAVVAFMPAEGNMGVEGIRARSVNDAGGGGEAGTVVILRKLDGGSRHPAIVFASRVRF